MILSFLRRQEPQPQRPPERAFPNCQRSVCPGKGVCLHTEGRMKASPHRCRQSALRMALVDCRVAARRWLQAGPGTTGSTTAKYREPDGRRAGWVDQLQ